MTWGSRARQRMVRSVVCALCVVAALLVAPVPKAIAQSSPTQTSGIGAGKSWSQLTPAQRAALQPLEKDWSSIDAQRKQKWIELAARFDKMPLEERARTQQRMADWARLSPQERNEARLNFQGARQLSPQERQERWEAYKALPAEQRRFLASQAKVNNASVSKASRADSKSAGPKVNTVSNPFLDIGRPSAVTPGVMQAKPGATTRPIAAKPSPPLHQQAGLPKVAATPEFVDTNTLLPQRGAQAAAVGTRDGAQR